jgi:small-conductance mechanosensitive channel
MARRLALALVVLWVVAAPAAAQVAWWLGGGAVAQGGGAGAPAAEAELPQPPDYEEWARFAARAEDATEDPRTTNLAFEQLRAQLAEWRERFQAAQNTNRARIETIRTQIAALGPPPAEGATEAPEIATRRAELTEQLARLEAPGIAADEAYRRADGLIREIDGILRDRQADELLRLWPAPLNPTNWPAGVSALTGTLRDMAAEVADAWDKPGRQAELRQNLPLILLYLAFAAVLILRGRRWMEALTDRLESNASASGRAVWSLVVSLGQIVLPTAGVYALAEAIRATGMVGLLGDVAVSALPAMGITIFAANWLGARIFPKTDDAGALLQLPAERRAEGRFHTASFGILLAADTLRIAVLDPGRSEAATAVLSFPILAVAGLLLFRIGQLLRLHVAGLAQDGEGVSPRNRLIGLFGRAAMAIGVAGPILAGIGYVSAAAAIVYPAVLSLALMALVSILQQLIADLYALVLGRGDEKARDALIPTLAGFVLVVGAVPLLALIWGARMADLTEIWNRFREGFTLGDTRIAPADFLWFAVVFGIGYGMTRLVQGALKTAVLPKTSLDTGGQNAIVAGTGYVGIVVSALVAITAAGIDLSAFAIVAGALSVGIGFGLQNIVSNFVSGIILLVERPVSEGDWIEVGGVQGVVRSISVRSTRIQTFDRTDVIVPNSDLIAGRVTNWTRFNLTGRIIIPVGVAYGSDTRKVERILREIAEAQPLAVLSPPPAVLFMGFGPDSLNFEIRIILRDVNFSLSVRSEVNHQIARRFAEEGIEIPFAQRDLHIRNLDALAAALRGERCGEPPPAPLAPEAKGPAHLRADEATVDTDLPFDLPSRASE